MSKEYSYTKDSDNNIRIWNGEGHLHCLYPYHMEKEVKDHVKRLNNPMEPEIIMPNNKIPHGFELPIRQIYQPIPITDADKIVSDINPEAVRDFYAKRENIDEDKPKEETVEEAAELHADGVCLNFLLNSIVMKAYIIFNIEQNFIMGMFANGDNNVFSFHFI
jgi:hypothetical protein